MLNLDDPDLPLDDEIAAKIASTPASVAQVVEACRSVIGLVGDEPGNAAW